jgi:hypothetical protein
LDATWEKLEEFKDYPEMQLDDELFVGEGRNVLDFHRQGLPAQEIE